VVAGRDEARLQQLVSNIGGGVPLIGDPCDPKQVSTPTVTATAKTCECMWQRCPSWHWVQCDQAHHAANKQQRREVAV
jgi:hypothetical protein